MKPRFGWAQSLARVHEIIVPGFVVLALAGCSKPPEANFVYRKEVLDLPAGPRKSIETTLTTYYGSPARPTFRQPRIDDAGQVELVDRADPADASRPIEPSQLEHGRQVYAARCAGCHGTSGDGAGPAAAYLNPKPRDYRLGRYKFTSTPYGAKPRRADLIRTIRRGAKGTSMPAFPWMTDEDLQAVVDYVIMLSHRGELENALALIGQEYGDEEAIEAEEIAGLAEQIAESWNTAGDQIVVPVSMRPPFDQASYELGYQAFTTKGCSKCHGADGRGYTQENVGKDAWGNIVRAADLTSGMLHGGRRPVDVYRRIHSGINGTPMPAFGPSLTEEPDTIWHLVHFVLGRVEGRELPAVALPPAPTTEEAGSGTSASSESGGTEAEPAAEEEPATETEPPAEPEPSPAAEPPSAEPAAGTGTEPPPETPAGNP